MESTVAEEKQSALGINKGQVGSGVPEAMHLSVETPEQ